MKITDLEKKLEEAKAKGCVDVEFLTHDYDCYRTVEVMDMVPDEEPDTLVITLLEE